MRFTWNTLRIKIFNKQLFSKTWLSDRYQLNRIIDAAERMGIDPTYANEAPISNLRDIIKFLKLAVRHNNNEYMVTLLRMAATLNTYNLRKEVGTLKTSTINFRTNNFNGIKQVELSISEDEFAHIRLTTKRMYSYEEISS